MSPRKANVVMAGMLVLVSIGLAACGGDSTEDAGDAGTPFEVASRVISAENTQEIGVWAPDADGSWPIVIGFHGQGGTHEAWDGLATELAAQGVVVFVPEYRSMSSSADEMKTDLVCGIQHALSVAGEYGGDPDQPYVFVGHSLGAQLVMSPQAEVREGTEGALAACFEGLPSGPDVIVSMAGCHYESPDGAPYSVTLPSPGTPVTLVAGEDDQTCEAWQSEDAAAALEAAGYDTTLVVIPGGTHGTPLFLDDSQEPWPPVPTDDPGGQQAVNAILTAIEAGRG